MKNRFPREFYIPAGSVKVADKNSTAVAYLYDTKSSKPGAVCFAGKADKPAAKFYFNGPKQREQFVKNFFERQRAIEANRVAARQNRKAFVHSVQVGDIYRTCWGYDQTNVEFFEVVEVNGKYALLREIAAESISNGHGQDTLMPLSGAFLTPRYKGDDRGLPIRRLIQPHGIKIDDVRTARAWGKRVAGVVIGQPATATSSGWGH